ncbi:hypothetical protein GCM10010510_30230 [Streptomyces anandii JCM 4720]|nr:hypothetical protein GCM10010510_30230 [Streptomyces anandii JCM 4720]
MSNGSTAGLNAMWSVAHDLAVARQVGERVAGVRRGRIVEEGPADAVYESPEDPDTEQLLAAVPALDPEEPGGPAARGATGSRHGGAGGHGMTTRARVMS